ncbi:unnamed protein product [Rotaria socialis]|uniref:Reverse transcriptase domain-containing protein n=1 Tax=Rotaria socialis TaxID=392032 RepID=A0A820Z4X1_9BILA|nr:unnamed protein product [Rotaria socialis]
MGVPQASICVFTEAGELWNTSQIPHFNIFHQHGTNKSGGVCIAIGKHLKGSRIDLNIENTIIVDIDGLSETVTIIAIYWPAAGVPRCEQARPISLLATHSKLFEKIMLDRIRLWAETNSLVPIEQLGFRPGCLLPTRVLSIYQEVKNNMTANTPTLAIYVDYQKAYDKVWHKGLIVKLNRLSIPLGLLK